MLIYIANIRINHCHIHANDFKYETEHRYANVIAGLLEDLPMGLLGLHFIFKTSENKEKISYLVVRHV